MNLSYRCYSFLKATQGNWRNSIFVSCECKTCPYTQEPGCEGYLMSAGSSGAPIILSVDEFRKKSGESIDPEECAVKISRTTFEDVFYLFIKWNSPYIQQCPLKLFSEYRYKEL